MHMGGLAGFGVGACPFGEVFFEQLAHTVECILCIRQLGGAKGVSDLLLDGRIPNRIQFRLGARAYWIAFLGCRDDSAAKNKERCLYRSPEKLNGPSNRACNFSGEPPPLQ